MADFMDILAIKSGSGLGVGSDNETSTRINLLCAQRTACQTSIAELRHFYAVSIPDKNFDAAPKTTLLHNSLTQQNIWD
jgi:hypothetical protein